MEIIDKLYKEAKKIKALVIGDICLDINSIGEYSGLSRETPKKPIFKISNQTMNLGGGGNLAMNLKKVGIDVTVLGVFGRDIYGKQVLDIMSANSIRHKYMVDQKRTYVFAKFYHESGEHIERMDILGDGINERENEKLAENFNKLMSDNTYDAIFIADYDENRKGVFSSDRLIGLLGYKRATTKYYGTSRSRTSMFNFLDYIFLNEEELINQFGHNEEQFYKNKNQVLNTMKTDNVILTLGSEGIGIFRRNVDFVEYTKTKKVENPDTCGCGDTLMAFFSICNLMGINDKEASKIANSASRAVASIHFGANYSSSNDVKREYLEIYG